VKQIIHVIHEMFLAKALSCLNYLLVLISINKPIQARKGRTGLPALGA